MFLLWWVVWVFIFSVFVRVVGLISLYVLILYSFVYFLGVFLSSVFSLLRGGFFLVGSYVIRAFYCWYFLLRLADSVLLLIFLLIALIFSGVSFRSNVS